MMKSATKIYRIKIISENYKKNSLSSHNSLKELFEITG